jgi:hypothetical protein
MVSGGIGIRAGGLKPVGPVARKGVCKSAGVGLRWFEPNTRHTTKKRTMSRDVDQSRRLQSQRMALLLAFVGLAIGAGIYRLSKAAFSHLDGLTNTEMRNAAAATTLIALLIFVVVATLWPRSARRSRPQGTARASGVDSVVEADGHRSSEGS